MRGVRAAWTPVHGEPGSDSRDEVISVRLSASLIGLNLPAQHTAFDGSLYGNLHHRTSKKKKTFSRPTEYSNYTISVR